MRSRPGLVTACAGFRVRADDDSLPAITRLALRDSPGVQLPDDQLVRTKARLQRTTSALAPALVARKVVDPDTASAILVSAGDNPHRLHNERAFAALPGGSTRSRPAPARPVDIASTAVATGN